MSGYAFCIEMFTQMVAITWFNSCISKIKCSPLFCLINQLFIGNSFSNLFLNIVFIDSITLESFVFELINILTHVIFFTCRKIEKERTSWWCDHESKWNGWWCDPHMGGPGLLLVLLLFICFVCYFFSSLLGLL